MDAKNIRRFSLTINTVILLMVLGLMLFFHLCKASILVYFSIPTFFVYIFGYILILRRNLHFYLCLVYTWLTLYMSFATICLGYEFGFYLYSLSMIPILHYTNYIAYKLKQNRIKTPIFSAAILACYLASTGYVAINGPIYHAPTGAAGVFWFTNSLIVFYFMITYTKQLIKTTINSEEKLKEMSYADRLTGLYNRHFMMEELSDLSRCNTGDALAMIDIDNFKKINDIYGHNAGDYVLKKLADIMRVSCHDQIVSRWGGEEFLILLKDMTDVYEHLETLRKAVESSEFVYEDRKIDVTITIGYAMKNDTASLDEWIRKADEKLYYGKNNGKNVVNG